MPLSVLARKAVQACLQQCAPIPKWRWPVNNRACFDLQDAFLDLILPVVSSTVKAAEEAGEGQSQPAANVAPQVLKALRRRERLARHKKKSTSAEGNTIFKASSTLY